MTSYLHSRPTRNTPLGVLSSRLVISPSASSGFPVPPLCHHTVALAGVLVRPVKGSA